MTNTFFDYFNMWKDRYEAFVMDRVEYIDPSKKKHILCYLFPLVKDQEMKSINISKKSNLVKFERKKISLRETKDMLSLILNEPEKLVVSYPDGVKYDPQRFKGKVEEVTILNDSGKNIGNVNPCYRLIYNTTSSSLFEEPPFTLISEIGYSYLSDAIMRVFEHPNKIFTPENYSHFIAYPLVIDLSHYTWRINSVEIRKKRMYIKIEKMIEKEIVRPQGKLRIEYLSGESQWINTDFDKNNEATIELERALKSYEFFLMSEEKIGFGGDKYNPKDLGKVLDYFEYRNPSTYNTNPHHINLDKLDDNDILEYIEEGESDKVEFKTTLESGKYYKLGKQLVGMANAMKGGLAIIGVSKMGDVVGIGDMDVGDVKDSLMDCLDVRCNPYISFTSKQYDLKIKNVTRSVFVISILVNEDDLPYLYRRVGKKWEIPIRRIAITKWMSPNDLKSYMQELHEERRRQY